MIRTELSDRRYLPQKMFVSKYIIILSCILISLGFAPLLNIGVYGLSPSFSNQEISNRLLNWIDINKQTTTSIGNPSTDISRVTYLSDGRILNATLWLSAPIRISNDTSIMSYGMLIDADSNQKTGLQGIDYQLEVRWQNGTWTKILTQWSSAGQARILDMERNYTGFFGKQQPYVLLTVNLASLNYPLRYNVIYYTQEKSRDGSRWIEDFTNWVHIPTPEFTISTLPSSTALRPGEEKSVEVQIKSLTDRNSQVLLFTDSPEGIGTSIIPKEISVPGFGIATSVLQLKASENATPQSHILHIIANQTFPPTSFFESRSSGISYLTIPPSLKSENTTRGSDLSLIILPPLTATERFLSFYSAWISSSVGTTLAGIGIIYFGLRFGFTKFSRTLNRYKRRIDSVYNSSYNNKEECLRLFREIKMEIAEIFDKGKIRHKDYEKLNKKISQYINEVSNL